MAYTLAGEVKRFPMASHALNTDSKARDERQLFWLGVLLVGFPVVIGLFNWRQLDRWAIIALWPVLVGVGLLFARTRAHPAVRLPGAALLSLVALADGASLVLAFWHIIRRSQVWGLFNALGAFCLVAWLCWRGVQLLIRRGSPRHRWVTPTVLGLAVAGISASHLLLWGVTSNGHSFHFSGGGVSLVGFWGWKYWYVAALVVGVSLVFGGHKIRGYAAGALFVLCWWLLLWALRDDTVPAFAATVTFLSWRFWREFVATTDVPIPKPS